MKRYLFLILFSCCLFSLSTQASVASALDSAPVAEVVPNKININQANAATLTHSFKGIGQKRAEAIVHEREAHGEFKSVEELSRVRGLGKRFVTKNLAKLDLIFTVK